MTRSDFGFALALGSSLLLPQIMISGANPRSSVCVGIVPLVAWFLWTLRMPKLWSQRALLLYVCAALWLLLVTMASLRPMSILYAAQYFAYALLWAWLLPWQMANRPDASRRIILWVSAIFAAEVIVSYFLGPLSPDAGFAARTIGGDRFPRALGVVSSPNLAGGLLAMMAVYAFAHGGRSVTLLCVLALVATRSVSALLALGVALAVLWLLWMARPLAKPVYLAAMLCVVTIVFGTTIAAIATEMMPDMANADFGERFGRWSDGLRGWLDIGWHAAFGAGMNSSLRADGAFLRPHNTYVEILTDAGVWGLALFVLAMTAAFLPRAVRIVLGGEPTAHGLFVVMGLTAMATHSLSQQFLYSVQLTPLLVIALLAMPKPLRSA